MLSSYTRIKNLGLLALSAAILLTGGLSWLIIHRLVATSHDEIFTERKKLSQYSDIANRLANVRQAVDEWEFSGAKTLANALRETDRVLTICGELKIAAATAEETKNLEGLARSVKSIKTVVNAISAAETRGEDFSGATTRAMVRESRGAMYEVLRQSDRAATEIRRQLSAKDSNLIAITQRAQAVLAIIIVLGVTSAIVIGVLMTRTLSRPIALLTEAMEQIAVGNLSWRIKVPSSDFVGKLARAFDGMARELEETTKNREDLLKALSQANAEAKRLREQIEFILGATNTGLDIIDADFNIRYIDSEWRKIYGDPAGKKCYAYFMDRTEVCPNCGIVKALKTMRREVTEETLPKENNRPIQVTTIPFQDENGEWLVAEVNVDITERKANEARVATLGKELQHASLYAGMAEVASGVLHNIGNVLNSVNVSAALIAEKLDQSELANLLKVIALLREREADLAAFLTDDPQGKHALAYLERLGETLRDERATLRDETDALLKSIDHINEIVRMQQDYARTSGLFEKVSLKDLVEDALRLNEDALKRHQAQVFREYGDVPPIVTQKHKILQILVNLVRNAKYALAEVGPENRKIILRVGDLGDGNVRVEVTDTGKGIPREHLPKIFAYGFTTRKVGGHGFGLHISALTARELGGALRAFSDGPGKGATFALEIPITPKGYSP